MIIIDTGKIGFKSTEKTYILHYIIIYINILIIVIQKAYRQHKIH